MAVEASRWVTYDEAAVVLGLSADMTRRLALRNNWPRRQGSSGMLVAVPDCPGDGPFEADAFTSTQDGGDSLLEFLKGHVERLTEELAEARTEMRGIRYEAESLRVEAGRAQVLAALVEAERRRSGELRADRDRVAAELAEHRRAWFMRTILALIERRPAHFRPR